MIAREQGYRTWQSSSMQRHRRASTAMWRRHGGVDGEDVVVHTDLTYGPHEPVPVTVRKRGWRFDVSDAGNAVAAAGSPPGWQAVAEAVVDEHALNVNRRGVVFVQANEARVAGLVERVAACSLAVYEKLLEHE